MAPRKRHARPSSRSWDPVAAWYTGWVGPNGSDHHRELAIPALLALLEVRRGERVLDLGCGPGVLAADIPRAGAHYMGVDASAKLLAFARRHHGRQGSFILGDVTRFAETNTVEAESFDAVTFLLSIQDIEPLDGALASASYALAPGGRVVMLMTHPCFRVPRQSGWGWDAGRRLRFRRVDRYLTRLDVPMQMSADGRVATRSYHRPLEVYVNELAANEMVVDRIVEIPAAGAIANGAPTRAERLALREFPLFLGIRAVKR
jgi:SAM-dependent methyltransferase